MNTFQLELTMVTVTCPDEQCGVTFALPKKLQEELRSSHRTFYCPHGHSQWYPEQTEEEKLRDELARERHCCEQKGARVRDLEAQRSAMPWALRRATEEALDLSKGRRTVYWRGYHARENGVPQEECPYQEGGGWEQTWLDGWSRPGDERQGGAE